MDDSNLHSAFAEFDLQPVKWGWVELRDQWLAVAVRPFWRLWWNDAPGAIVVSRRREYRLTPNELLLVPPQTPVACRLEGNLRTFYLHFAADRPPGPPGAPYALAADPTWRPLLKKFITALATGEAAPLAWLARALGALALAQTPAELWRPQRLDPRIAQTAARLEAEPRRRFANPELAASVHLATNSFIRLFRRELGCSPQDYHCRRRLELACAQLQQTSASLEAIAEACGFCDRNYFSRVFTRHYGLGPASFRKRPL